MSCSAGRASASQPALVFAGGRGSIWTSRGDGDGAGEGVATTPEGPVGRCTSAPPTATAKPPPSKSRNRRQAGARSSGMESARRQSPSRLHPEVICWWVGVNEVDQSQPLSGAPRPREAATRPERPGSDLCLRSSKSHQSRSGLNACQTKSVERVTIVDRSTRSAVRKPASWVRLLKAQFLLCAGLDAPEVSVVGRTSNGWGPDWRKAQQAETEDAVLAQVRRS